MPTYTLTAAQLNNRILNSFIIPSSGGSVDPDAQAFITAAGITDPTQQSAINALVVGMKAQGLWTKMKAIYPFVGGTATTHKWNLKDPRDLNAAYRLAFTGAWIHSSNGIQGNSFNCYVDTYFDAAAAFGALTYSGHFSYYSRTIVPPILDGLLYDDFGIQAFMGEGPLTTWVGDLGFGSGVNIWTKQIPSEVIYNLTAAGLNTQGLFTTSRVNQNLLVLYRNSTSLGSNTDESFGWSNDIIIIGKDNIGTPSTNQPKKQYAFATIGNGLTSTDTSNLSTLVQAFQTTLGRQV